ncbi:hypothetical protein HMPREF1254_0924 [Prevotella sp. BV3P1]|nr:hypothetical protein HMPREF1254_0924 [Prevotella sp. BV3P1]
MLYKNTELQGNTQLFAGICCWSWGGAGVALLASFSQGGCLSWLVEGFLAHRYP